MAKEKQLKDKQLATNMVHAGSLRSQYGEVSEALFLNSGFTYDDAQTAESRFNGEAPGFVYSRYLNPSLKMLEDRLIALESGAEAACVMASGMAAVFASMMSFLKTGDHVVAGRVLFGSCYYIITEILPRFGISHTLVHDTANPQAWQDAMRPQTRCLFIESPANPILGLTDIAAVSDMAHRQDATVIVDNIFAGPLCQQPFQLGADVVVYSTTKHLDGQGRTLGGAVLGREAYIQDTLLPFHRHTGPAMSPFTAWLILKSLETYPLRMQQHVKNAQALATRLAEHPKIDTLYYPHDARHPHHELAKQQMSNGGSMIAFSVKGGKEAAFRLMNQLNIISISNNLGDAKSLITHPATTTHSNIDAPEREDMGITDGMLRLSVGLEDIRDLTAELETALEQI